jgi:hypothetical protein
VNVTFHRAKYKALAPALTECALRTWAATAARATRRGGVTWWPAGPGLRIPRFGAASRSRHRHPTSHRAAELRRTDGGRKKTLAKELRTDLEGLAELTASGHPEPPLRCTSKSVRKPAETLQTTGHAVGRQPVVELLRERVLTMTVP